MGKKRENTQLAELTKAVELLARRPAQPPEQPITQVATELVTLRTRVEALEARILKVVGEAEALVQRAESRFRTARSAEERARRYAREAGEEYEDDDELDDDYEPGPAMGNGSGAQAVQPVHEALPPGPPLEPIDIARAKKWAR